MNLEFISQIATLEMKELNERQRADHVDNKYKLVKVKNQDIVNKIKLGKFRIAKIII